MKKDYEVFIGPFSAHAYSDYELFDLFRVAKESGMITAEKAEEAIGLAAGLISSDKSTMRAWSNISIHNRALEDELRRKHYSENRETA